MKKKSTARLAQGKRSLSRLQLIKLNRGLGRLRRRNRFYKAKFENTKFPLVSAEDIVSLPFTTKDELVLDQEEHPPYGTNLTSPLTRYTRVHATSGTTGRKLKWLDSDRTWAWFVRCWQEIYRAAGLERDDVVFAAFGFGPFIGFWGGFEAAQELGAMVVAGGAQSSLQRIDWLRDIRATVLLSTPTYALRLAEVARENGIDLSSDPIRLTIHAGEPGASIPATRRRIEEAWGARAFDHAGSTEVGAWGYECPAGAGMHLLESEFIGEVLEVGGDHPVEPGESGELVLTNLGRWDMPVVRYRTGDIVRLGAETCECGSPYVCFPGAVLGRADDMIQLRGMNLYPSAVEELVRSQSEVVEFEVEVFRHRQMLEMEIRVEVLPESRKDVVCNELSRTLATRLGLQTTVRPVATGSLPRYELKARRFKIRNE
jgi:phenylacetate-CoA ligase